MTIKMRMIIGIVGAIFFLLVSNLVTQFLINQTNQTIHEIIHVNGVKLSLLSELKSVSDERAIMQRNLVLVTEPEKVEVIKGQLKESASQIFDIFEKLNTIKLDPQESAFYESLKVNVSGANAVFGSFMLAVEEEFLEEAVDILINAFAERYGEFTAIIAQWHEYEINQNEQAIATLAHEQLQAEYLIWSWLAISIFLFSIFGYFVARSFLRPIDAMVKTAFTIAHTGDLSHRIPVSSKDELGQVSVELNSLFSRMNNAISDVISVMNKVANGQFDKRVEVGKKGQFLELKEGVNQSIEQINSVVKVMQKTASNFRAGKLEVSKDESIALQGAFSDMMYDLDRSSVQMKATVESISSTLKSLALGDFSVRSEVDARGDFIALKESINQTLNDLEKFVNEVANVQSKVSEGDLTDTVKGIYRGKMAVLKDAINSSVSNTSVMVSKVGAIAGYVAEGSEGLAQGNETISERILQQAAALEETSATMEEMTSTVRQNADNAMHANQMTQEAQGQLSNGLQTMQEALGSMDQMASANQKIHDIISIIDSIAFQTNLLALNAAVEAARAGEHGRGFAVVAGEVRNLAGKSAEAAGEIKGLIENSVKISENSGQFVKQTGEVMSALSTTMTTVGGMVSEISQASSQQAKGIDQINEAIASMDSMTQKNAQVVRQAAESSEELLNDAHLLTKEISHFKVDDVTLNRMHKLIRSEQGSQFEKMIEAHIAWKSKIRAFVEGMDIGVSYEAATDHTACVLGKWYYGDGQQYMNLPLMKTLGDEHREMHQAIKRVMDSQALDDGEMVAKELEKVDHQSAKVVEILYQMIDQI
ncbi:MAG: HAMP domain-containing protein [Thiotrichales bacterium]|nr:HAMP domain-containing protein [Thiotrichales bacterium]